MVVHVYRESPIVYHRAYRCILRRFHKIDALSPPNPFCNSKGCEMLNEFDFAMTAIKASPPIIDSFNSLLLDPYSGGGSRFRRFSQYELAKGHLRLLPHRPFVQPKSYNPMVGGVLREFAPLVCDPSDPVLSISESGGLNMEQIWQVNVHQIRTICTQKSQGIVVPEGPHQDGHMYVALWVVRRNNITGGETSLLPLHADDPFFTHTIEAGESLVFDDRKMRHNTTNITSVGPDSCRESFIIVFNPWAERRYGDEHERTAICFSGS